MKQKVVVTYEYPIEHKEPIKAILVLHGDKVESTDIERYPVAKWKMISPAKIYECSNCGRNIMTDDIDVYYFCMGCGAKMCDLNDEHKNKTAQELFENKCPYTGKECENGWNCQSCKVEKAEREFVRDLKWELEKRK